MFIETPLPHFFFIHQIWYLTPCCGLEVQKPTQALKSVKGPRNTFDLSSKQTRTLPSLIYFSWVIYRDQSFTKTISNIKIDIWHPAVGFKYRNSPRHFIQLTARARALPINLSPKLERNVPSLIYFSCDIYRDPSSKLIFDTLLWGMYIYPI
jgi:hypothetical protein